MLGTFLRILTARSYVCNSCGHKFEDEDLIPKPIIEEVPHDRPIFHSRKEKCPKCGSEYLSSKKEFF